MALGWLQVWQLVGFGLGYACEDVTDYTVKKFIIIIILLERLFIST